MSGEKWSFESGGKKPFVFLGTKIQKNDIEFNPMNSVQRASLKQILSPPPLQRLKQGSETAKRILAEGTLEDWLKFRDWHHVLPGPVPIDPIEFLSALLTYPLTIAKTFWL